MAVVVSGGDGGDSGGVKANSASDDRAEVGSTSEQFSCKGAI